MTRKTRIWLGWLVFFAGFIAVLVEALLKPESSLVYFSSWILVVILALVFWFPIGYMPYHIFYRKKRAPS